MPATRIETPLGRLCENENGDSSPPTNVMWRVAYVSNFSLFFISKPQKLLAASRSFMNKHDAPGNIAISSQPRPRHLELLRETSSLPP